MSKQQVEQKQVHILISRQSSNLGYQSLIASIVHLDETDNTPRNVLDGGLDHLTARCTVYTSVNGDPRAYWDIEYRDCYSLGLHQLEQKVKALRKVINHVNSIEVKEGGAETFGEQVRRFALAVNAKYILTYASEDAVNVSGSYSDSQYNTYTIARGAKAADDMVSVIIANQTAKAA